MNKSGDNIPELNIEICQHLAALKINFDYYFDDTMFVNVTSWIIHLFETKLEDINDDDLCKDELIDLQSSTVLRDKFNSCNGHFSKLWGGLTEGFPLLTKRAFKIIVPFATTYLCEAGFIKAKHQSLLVPKDDMRLALSATAPRISKIVGEKQEQKSN